MSSTILVRDLPCRFTNASSATCSLPLSLWRRGETGPATLSSASSSARSSCRPRRSAGCNCAPAAGPLIHAYDQCPFYRQRFKEAGFAPGDLRRLEDLRALPPLEKRDIQEHGADMVARELAGAPT